MSHLHAMTFPDAIDSTILSAYGSCPQKFLLEFCLKRAPIGRSIHLHAGGAFAAAIETFRLAFYHEQLPKAQCLEKAMHTFTLFWGDFATPEKEYKDFVNVWSALVAYINEYPPETDHFQPLMLQDGKPAVEFKFAIPMKVMHPVTGNPLLFSGRMDMLSTDQNGVLYAVDEKTTKALGASWQYQWEMRGQLHGYTYAARVLGYPCVGALVRGIAIQQTQFGFQEKPLFFTDHQLENWWRTMNDRAERMVEDYENALQAANPHAHFAYSYGEACTSYGNCVYQDCCKSATPWRVYEDYERREWNPLEKDPTVGSEDRMSQLGEVSWEEFMGQDFSLSAP